MASDTAKKGVQKVLAGADIQVDGDRPWDLQVHDERLYRRMLQSGTLGFGEAYMDGWWDSNAIDEMTAKLLDARAYRLGIGDWRFILAAASSVLTNHQSIRKAFRIGHAHYDIGNDLYRAMLDPRMTYSCGYWKDAKNLAEAQEAKLDLVCRKLGLKPGMRVLDIGCGWGSFAKYAAEKYGVSVVGVTVSAEQVELGRKLCAGLPVEILLQDYRSLEGEGQFDRIASIGMFEHVGPKNYREYMKVARRLLKDDGLFLLHTIGANKESKMIDPWINSYIFPGAVLPSVPQIAKASQGLFVLEDWHSFGPDYDRTLLAWHENFERAWPSLKEKYGERFYRMWRYYLLACAGSFRSRRNQLWQIVLSKEGVRGRYDSIR